jgi:hypothetical protein
MFELQDDAGDEERVKMNLIELARKQGTLKRTETKDEIRFQGKCVIPMTKELKEKYPFLATEGDLKNV